jgi:hypothetical protein
MRNILFVRLILVGTCMVMFQGKTAAQRNTLHDLNGVVRLQYQNPGLSADLGVGLWAWPLPIDFDQDGTPELLLGAEDGHFYYLPR